MVTGNRVLEASHLESKSILTQSDRASMCVCGGNNGSHDALAAACSSVYGRITSLTDLFVYNKKL